MGQPEPSGFQLYAEDLSYRNLQRGAARRAEAILTTLRISDGVRTARFDVPSEGLLACSRASHKHRRPPTQGNREYAKPHEPSISCRAPK